MMQKVSSWAAKEQKISNLCLKSIALLSLQGVS